MIKLALKHRFWFITALVVLIFFAGLKWGTKSKKIESQTSKSSLTVTVVEPHLETVEAELHLSGLTVPQEEVLVVSELSGLRVQEVFAQVGQKVKKGQVLASLDKESLTHQVAQLSGEYARVYDEYQRFEKLKHTGAISQHIMSQKKADCDIAKARLDDAKLNLHRTNVVAPKDGIIFERKASIGDAVGANQPLYRIAHGNIEFQADVPEASLTNIQVGQKVKLIFSGHPKALMGSVRLIAPNINYMSRTAAIRISLDKQDDALHFPIGLYGQAEIVTGQIEGFSLPETALQQDSMGSYVWGLDKQSKAIRLPVNVTLHTNGRVVIKTFEPGLKVVAKAGAFVKKGESLDTVEAS